MGAIPPSGATTTTIPVAGPSRSRRAAIIALVALGVAAVAVAAVILLTSGGSTPKPVAKAAPVNASISSDGVYRGKLQGILATVVSANHGLSSALTAIDGSSSANHAAQRAASGAQATLLTARGAVGALTVPSSDQTLSEQVQQALGDETGYVTAVSDTLNNPSSSQAAQLQTLATVLQSALVPLGPIVAGASNSVSGTSNLTSWANSAAKAAQGSSSSSGSSSSGSGSSSSSANANPYSNGTACGGGLFAGPTTSCPFAENVQQAYNQAPGSVAIVQAFSPVTGQTYSMSCAPAGSGITCSGANNASVSW
jgi:hypothetical protein